VCVSVCVSVWCHTFPEFRKFLIRWMMDDG
jgi:hypothetical protein